MVGGSGHLGSQVRVVGRHRANGGSGIVVRGPASVIATIMGVFRIVVVVRFLLGSGMSHSLSVLIRWQDTIRGAAVLLISHSTRSRGSSGWRRHLVLNIGAGLAVHGSVLRRGAGCVIRRLLSRGMVVKWF